MFLHLLNFSIVLLSLVVVRCDSQKPSVIADSDQVILNSGDVFTFRCVSAQPVRWKFDSLDPAISSRLTVVDSKEGSNYSSVIEVESVSYLDVGYKYCIYSEDTATDFSQDNSTAARIYLFVNDTNNLLFMKPGESFKLLEIVEGQRSVIPCKPTAPNVTVLLLDAATRQVSEAFMSSSVFDPRLGFIIDSASFDQHSQSVVCQAESAGSANQMTMIITFIKNLSFIEKPFINMNGSRNIVEGTNFSLECLLALGNRKLVHLSWQVPGASTGLKTGRMLEQEQSQAMGRLVPSASEQLLARRVLLVTQVRLQDAGPYVCTAAGLNGVTSQATHSLVVHDKSSSSVKLIPHRRKFLLKSGEDLKVAIEVDAYPDPILTWRKPNGDVIGKKDEKFTMSMELYSVILLIRKLSLDDMGTYRLEARSPDHKASDSVAFNVSVLEDAKVNTATSWSYYMVDEKHTLRCSSTGNPLPQVWWSFAACFSNHSCSPAVNVSNAPSSNSERVQQKRVGVAKVRSEVDVIATQSGLYSCLASNGPTKHSANILFYVTDVAGGFGASISHTPVVAGDAISLICSGNIFEYASSSSLSWYRRGDNNDLQPMASSSDWSSSSNTTRYSYQQILTSASVSQAAAGVYVCTGSNNTGPNRSAEVQLQMLEAEAPQFLDDANVHSEARMKVAAGRPLVLNCSVTGSPTPSVVWYKDNIVLEPELQRVQKRVFLFDCAAEAGCHRLWIGAAIAEDAAVYRCLVRNRLGEISARVALEVVSDGVSALVVVLVTGLLLLVFLAFSAVLIRKIRQQKKLQHKLTARDLETFTNGMMSQYNPVLSIEEQAELLPYDMEWEFPRDKLILGRQIGSGAFGRVVKAEAMGLLPHEERTVVAVKMPRSSSDPGQIKSLMAELKIMIQLGRHLNVVNLLGAVTRHAVQGDFFVMVEFCRFGNLHEYLLKHKHSFVSQLDPVTGEFSGVDAGGDFTPAYSEDTIDSVYKSPRPLSSNGSVSDSATYVVDITGSELPVNSRPDPFDDNFVHFESRRQAEHSVRDRARVKLTTKDLLQWTFQVANGMKYLASRKLLHGDLAARNILLADNGIVKISDFGLSRDIYKTQDYKKTAKGLLPVKWMAIESIQDSIFSTETDVWSFGVVMWEFFSLGASPYPGMEYDINFVRRLRDGYRMSMPAMCPQSVYRLMVHCWSHLPADRPSFSDLATALSHQLEQRITQEYARRQLSLDRFNSEYFDRRAIYVNQIVAGNYENVDAAAAAAGPALKRLEMGAAEGEESDTARIVDFDTLHQHVLIKGLSAGPSDEADENGNCESQFDVHHSSSSSSPDPDETRHYLVPRKITPS